MSSASKIIFLLLLFHCLGQIQAQRVEPEKTLVDFGTVFENQPDSQEVWVYNRHVDTIALGNATGLGLYGQIPWQLRMPNSSIAPGDSVQVRLVFQPQHNVPYTLPLIIENDAHRGPIAMEIRATGRYSDPYYNSTNDLKEEALKTALTARLANGYRQQSYSAARDQMYMVIDNQRVNGRGATQNTTECMYSARVAAGYTNRSDVQVSFQFDTEHVWPQSFFNQNLPMRSDIHHLFPTWRTANSTRGSFPFGVVTGTPSWSVGGSKLGNSIFEPRDYAKGRTARAMMYFVLRYQNYNNFMNSQEAVLRSWHAAFPPDSIDRKRNDDIFAFQGNKNPFVDYPQFIDRITSLSSNSVEAPVVSLMLPEDSINYAEVQAGQPAVYTFVIVNDGNRDLELNQFTLDQPELSFVSGGNDTTISPGQFHLCKVSLNAMSQGSFSGQFSFSSNASSSPGTIPVLANVTGDVSNRPDLPEGLAVFPSPVREKLFVRWEGIHPEAQLEVLDTTGKLLIVNKISAYEEERVLRLERLSPGNYVLVVKAGGKHWSRTFSKE
jgi:endonuclease I